ncbi:MAG: glycerophosphodiester phosphodiesterase [Clostridia bacterium]|nr:glycerophosphodiester phosphodiesterase [Clostridia bacterium]
MTAAKIWAHRGASAYAPENTLEAFEMAMNMGAYGIELDVHRTKDGKLVVIHDETVDRTSNGTGYVKDYTCKELKRLDFSNSFDDYAGARIPTLGEVFGLIRNSSLRVNIEVKCDRVVYYGIWDDLIKLVRDFGMEDRVLYSSFNHYVLRKLKEVKPNADIGLLYNCVMLDPWIYAKYARAHAIHPHFLVPLRVPEMVGKCHAEGIVINAWTADSPEHIAGLIDAGVDGIITNCPDVALKLLDE